MFGRWSTNGQTDGIFFSRRSWKVLPQTLIKIWILYMKSYNGIVEHKLMQNISRKKVINDGRYKFCDYSNAMNVEEKILRTNYMLNSTLQTCISFALHIVRIPACTIIPFFRFFRWLSQRYAKLQLPILPLKESNVICIRCIHIQLSSSHSD